MTITETNVPAQASDEPIKTWEERTPWRPGGYCDSADASKAMQAEIAELRARVAATARPRATVDVELLEAVSKLIEAKGRFHTEQNYAAVVKAYDAATKGAKP